MLKRFNDDDSGLVFSTEVGSTCPKCNKSLKKCICKEIKANKKPTGDNIVRISRETKGRKGAGVTLITGIPLSPKELKLLAKELKTKCGCGGAIKDGVIELQGDVREKTKPMLEKRGFKVKLSGG